MKTLFTIEERGIRLEFAGLFVEFEKLLLLELYHRPEKKQVVKTGLHPFLKYRTDSSAALDLYDAEHGILIPLKLFCEGRRLRIVLDAGAIVETGGNTWRLMRIGVAADLLAFSATEKGEYLLPNYSGMLTGFDKQEKISNDDRIYMQQSEWEKFGLINAFGALFGKGAVLGIVHSGDFRAWIRTEMNFQPGRHRQFAVFGIRSRPSDFLEQEEKILFFEALPGTQDFTGMAFAFREYLRKDRGLSTLRERMRNNPVLEYAVKAMRLKIFMGQKTPFVADGKSPYANCTTFAEAEEIIDALIQAGIRKAIITLVGWNLGGHDGAYPTHFPVNEAAGGEAGLRRLIRKALDNGYQIVPHDGVCALYMGSPDFDRSYASRDEFGETQTGGMWAGGLLYLACPQVFLNRYGGEFLRIRELGFSGCYYVDGLANGLFRCSDPEHPANEKEFARGELRMIEFPRMLYGASSTENPAVYSLEFIDEAAHLQGENTWRCFQDRLPESLRKLEGRIIPFYNLAVHGLITYQTEWGHGLRKFGLIPGILQQFAVGARPAIEVSMRGLCNGDYYKDSIRDIRETYQLNFDLVPEIHEALIETYALLGEKAVRVTYDNGVEITVNWGSVPCPEAESLSLKIVREGTELFYRKYNASERRDVIHETEP